MNQRAFTLIELSIVLVIIGLIVGGVLVGQELVLASKRQKLLSDITKLETVANTFRVKYNGLPGDLKNASTFFSGARNGNGNKHIWAGLASFASNIQGYERCDFFRHLKASGLFEVETQTNGACAVSSPIIGNSPPLPFDLTRTTYAVTAHCAAADCALANGSKGPHYWFTNGVSNNQVTSSNLRAANTTSASYSHPFTVEDMRWFDTKVDDGQARTGNLVLMRVPSGGDGTWFVAANSDICIDNGVGDEYKTSETRRLCHMRVRMNF